MHLIYIQAQSFLEFNLALQHKTTGETNFGHLM